MSPTNPVRRSLELSALVMAGAVTGCSGGVLTSGASAQDPAPHCLNLVRIKHVEILDRRHIVFEMDNGDNYMNVLPGPCPSLHRNKALMYKTSLSRLCDLDIITVLDSVGGGYEPAGSCGLGKFREATQDEIRETRNLLKDPG